MAALPTRRAKHRSRSLHPLSKRHFERSGKTRLSPPDIVPRTLPPRVLSSPRSWSSDGLRPGPHLSVVSARTLSTARASAFWPRAFCKCSLEICGWADLCDSQNQLGNSARYFQFFLYSLLRMLAHRKNRMPRHGLQPHPQNQYPQQRARSPPVNPPKLKTNPLEFLGSARMDLIRFGNGKNGFINSAAP